MFGGVILLVVLTVAIGSADDDEAVSAGSMKRFDARTQTCRLLSDQNLIVGYRNFQAVCKSCHNRENDQGAKFLYTESKTRRAWDRVFTKMYPDCAKDGSWNRLATEDLLKVHDYLFTNAAGTYDSRCAA
jgi:hypothetical protein